MPYDILVKYYREDGEELDSLRESSLTLTLEEALPTLKKMAQELLDIEAITEDPARFLMIDLKTGNVVASGVRIYGNYGNAKKCPDCNGYGRICNPDAPPDEIICESCDGSGAIPGSDQHRDHCLR